MQNYQDWPQFGVSSQLSLVELMSHQPVMPLRAKDYTTSDSLCEAIINKASLQTLFLMAYIDPNPSVDLLY